jgi:hypothetical protein
MEYICRKFKKKTVGHFIERMVEMGDTKRVGMGNASMSIASMVILVIESYGNAIEKKTV